MSKILCIMFCCIQTLSSCSQKAESETYLIPMGFTGKVNIIFNQANGVPVKYTDGRRVYEIPPNGILLTQFNKNDGFIDRKYFYHDKNGELQPLKIFDMDTSGNKTFSQEEVGIFLNGVSGVYGNSRKASALEYQEFIVSNYQNLNRFFTDAYKNEFYEKIEKISGVKF